MDSEQNIPSRQSVIEITNVIAMLCRIHTIDMNELSSVVQNQNQNFDEYVISMAEQLSKQLVSGEIIIDSEDFLVPDPDFDVSEEEFDPKRKEEVEDDLEEDPDFDPTLSERVLIKPEDMNEKKFEKAWAYWTKQEGKDCDQVDYNWDNFLHRGKKRKVGSVASYYHLDEQLQSLKKWARRKHLGQITMRQLNIKVYEQFLDHRARNKIVTDRLIRLWAIKLKSQLVDTRTQFRATHSWLLKFKQRFNIVSRSITHKVGRNFFRDEETKARMREEFLQDVQKTMVEEGFAPFQVVNIDQSGFNKEMHGYRTMNIRGAKQIYVEVGSKNATTHSYTIMPMISMDGTLMSTLYLKSSESSSLGKGNDPQFPSTTVIPPGINAYPGTSAMMNKSDLQTYFREVFFAQLRQSNIDKCLLLCDSWSSNKDDASFNQIAADFPDIVVKRMLIPPGTTGTTQPLDVYYFRPLKVFIRFICDTLEIDDFKIWQRNNYFKLQAFAHFQFRADRFRDMIRYAFYKAGYLPERPPKFVTPCDYCFRFSELDCCSFESCSNMSDFKCAHCEQFFCFYHCIINELHIKCQ